jgi:hypothetical protein
MGSFFARLGRGRLEFDGWEQLWGLLVVITLRKCGKQRDYLRARLRIPAGRFVDDPTDGRGASIASSPRWRSSCRWTWSIGSWRGWLRRSAGSSS